MGADLIQGAILAAKSAAVAPVDEIGVTVRLQQPGDGLAPRPRSESGQRAEAERAQLRKQLRGDAVPRRDHDGQQTLRKQRRQPAPTFFQLGHHMLAAPVSSQLDGALSLVGVVLVRVPVLQYRNRGVVFKFFSQLFFCMSRNAGNRRRHAAVPVHLEQALERRRDRHRIVVTPPQRRGAAARLPAIELLGQSLPRAHGPASPPARRGAGALPPRTTFRRATSSPPAGCVRRNSCPRCQSSRVGAREVRSQPVAIAKAI